LGVAVCAQAAIELQQMSSHSSVRESLLRKRLEQRAVPSCPLSQPEWVLESSCCLRLSLIGFLSTL
jgi:hypothetical protein